MKVKISEIKVGKRIRKDIGSLDSLKNSMRKHGLMNPIVIDDKANLIAGFRRLSAASELGWLEIDANVIKPGSNVERLELEMEENLVRKEFLPEEMMDGLKRKKQLARPGFFRRILNFFLRLFGIR